MKEKNKIIKFLVTVFVSLMIAKIVQEGMNYFGWESMILFLILWIPPSFLVCWKIRSQVDIHFKNMEYLDKQDLEIK